MLDFLIVTRHKELSTVSGGMSCLLLSQSLMFVKGWVCLPQWPQRGMGLVGVSVQFSSVAQSCPTRCDPVNRSTPGLPVHHQLPEFIQTRVRRVSDAIQPSHPWSSPSPPASNPSQHQSLFQWVNSWHEVAKVLEFRNYYFVYIVTN